MTDPTRDEEREPWHWWTPELVSALVVCVCFLLGAALVLWLGYHGVDL